MIYLDFDGVLVTKFSDGKEFDKVCVHVLKELLALYKKQFSSVQLCIISNWRFDKTADELTELLVSARLLEHVDKLLIPTDYPNREQQILALQQDLYFLILDDTNYSNPQLQKN